MPAISMRCTACGARLKAPEGTARVRCPRCSAIIKVPQESGGAKEETLDELEEVVEDSAPARRRHDEDDDRPRRRRKRSAAPAWMDYLWLAAIGADAVCFVICFLCTFAAYGFRGFPENSDQGGGVVKIGALAFGVLCLLVFAGAGVLIVKNRVIYDKWGNATRGPWAVVLGMLLSLTGGGAAGVVFYGLLLALIRGR